MPDSHIVYEEVFTHEYLWRSSSALEKLVCADEQANHHLIIPAILTTVMAFEAFVNFCGVVVLPELWENEREEFRGKGVDGKLAAIAKQVPNFEFRKGCEPYQSIKKLFKFRDTVAHAKVFSSRYKTRWQDGASQFHWEHPWDVFVARSAVEKARDDVRSFAQRLVSVLRNDTDHHLHFLHDAFEGPLASGSSCSDCSGSGF